MLFTNLFAPACLVFCMMWQQSAASTGCGGKPADIVFILDASSSIWGPNFKKQLQFVRNVAEAFDIRPTKTRVGVLTFGSQTRTEFDLSRFSSRRYLLTSIDHIPQMRGTTRTDDALAQARDLFKRQQRNGVPKLAIVMTDGQSDHPGVTKTEAALLHKDGVHTFAVGIGRSVDGKELKTIASEKDYVFTVDNFDALNTLKEILAFKACEVKDETDFSGDDFLTPPPKACGGKPSDIVFALDASSSIWGPDFLTQLTFVQDLVGVFQISANQTRVGVLTFSDEPHREFHLSQFEDEKRIKEAVGEITQVRGGTNTAQALHTLRKHYLSPEHTRQGVVRIAIVITDGRSDNHHATAHQAALVKQAGIHVFAVGVGQLVDQQELFQIASTPSDQYVFMVDNYNALQTIKELLALQTCRVTDPPTTTPVPTTTPATTTTPVPTTPPLQKDPGCDEDYPAELVFAVPPEAGTNITRKILKFINRLTQEFHISDETVRVGMVPKDCQGIAPVQLNNNLTKEQLLDRFQLTHYSAAHTTSSVVRFMRNESFKKNVTRPHAKKIGLLFVDKDSEDIEEAAAESQRAQEEDIEMFVVGVGKAVQDEQLRALASKPADKHVINVADYSELDHARQLLKQRIDELCTDLTEVS